VAPPRTPDPPKRVLLATDGAPFTDEVLNRVLELAAPEHAKITVVCVAKVFGTSLGLPHPGLQPNRVELEMYRTMTNDAADALRAHGFEVRVAMSKSRNANKMIARWATAKNFHAVVVPDPVRPNWRRRLEGDPTTEIHRRSGVPVYAVPVTSPGPGAA
jgi:nucleotide-binding universal stress UspA family protein